MTIKKSEGPNPEKSYWQTFLEKTPPGSSVTGEITAPYERSPGEHSLDAPLEEAEYAVDSVRGEVWIQLVRMRIITDEYTLDRTAPEISTSQGILHSKTNVIGENKNTHFRRLAKILDDVVDKK